jgi:hypothetical protein
VEEEFMQSPNEAAAVSKTSLWIGRILSLLLVLFLIFDGVTKILKIPPVLKAVVQLGFSVRQIVGIGILLLVCTAIYAIPRTSVLGAILLAAYLGGATVTNLHAGNPLFETLFPVIFGILVWLGLYLRDRRLRALIPLRS